MTSVFFTALVGKSADMSAVLNAIENHVVSFFHFRQHDFLPSLNVDRAGSMIETSSYLVIRYSIILSSDSVLCSDSSRRQ